MTSLSCSLSFSERLIWHNQLNEPINWIRHHPVCFTPPDCMCFCSQKNYSIYFFNPPSVMSSTFHITKNPAYLHCCFIFQTPLCFWLICIWFVYHNSWLCHSFSNCPTSIPVHMIEKKPCTVDFALFSLSVAFHLN